ncbi:serine hydrolase [Bradyrhizobium sp. Ai1a-2]|uniref:serine hydrolase n=1 Tax=Bradyrhizobium sp. Ai1a-2 TaxID=196490 RepID=UPI00042833EE|nr:serine hydrolase [Bradyrhizobium sp. Ai1a-2]
MISRRLVIGLFGAGVIGFAPYPAPVTQASAPEARNVKLDETLRGLIEGRSTPGIVVLILQNGRPVYSRRVGVREVGSTELFSDNDLFRLADNSWAGLGLYARLWDHHRSGCSQESSSCR